VAAPIFCKTIAHLINMSLATSAPGLHQLLACDMVQNLVYLVQLHHCTKAPHAYVYNSHSDGLFCTRTERSEKTKTTLTDGVFAQAVVVTERVDAASSRADELIGAFVDICDRTAYHLSSSRTVHVVTTQLKRTVSSSFATRSELVQFSSVADTSTGLY